jgi:hypothetical protein
LSFSLDEHSSEKLMEQRPLRLGDIVDDYCPRERRITNHAIVAMTGEEIQQTRCAACDADHPYKHGKAPLKKKKDPNGGLYDEVLAGVLKPRPVIPDVAAAPPPASEASIAPVLEATPDLPAQPEFESESQPPSEPEPVANAWGHRPLIRAQLPRIEGQAPVIPRPLPEFTIRQQGSRGYGQPHNANGHGPRRGQGGQNQHQPHGHGGGRRAQGGRPQGRSRHSR